MLGLRLNFFLIANHQPKIENLTTIYFLYAIDGNGNDGKTFSTPTFRACSFCFSS